MMTTTTRTASHQPHARRSRRDGLVVDDDAALLTRVAAGDPRALAEVDRRYRALIVSVAWPILRDEGDLEEVVQDVLWTVHRKATYFRGDAAVSTWLYRVAQNAARMLLRKRKRRAIPLEDDVLAPMLSAHLQGAVEHMPDARAAGNRALHSLLRAVADLPEDQRSLFRAVDLEDQDRDRLAAELGVSMAALKARIFRVRTVLRTAMQSDDSAHRYERAVAA